MPLYESGTFVPKGTPQALAVGGCQVANINSDNVTIISGTTGNVTGNIMVGTSTNPDGIAYDSMNGYLYVTNDSSSNVTVINGNTNKLIGSINVGYEPFGVAFDSLTGNGYIDNHGSGTISIISTSPTYNTTFTESGQPSGTTWFVNLTYGLKSGPINKTFYSVLLANGTYSYNIGTTNKTLHANASSITVNGNNTTHKISFLRVSYTVTFTESGLSKGIHWNMTFNGATSSSNGTTITFSIVNGTYSYTVSNVSGYSITNGSGTFSVNGANVAKIIKFTSSPPGLSLMELIEIALVVVVIVAAVGVVLYTRKK